jgi:hypothetical protein
VGVRGAVDRVVAVVKPRVVQVVAGRVVAVLVVVVRVVAVVRARGVLVVAAKGVVVVPAVAIRAGAVRVMAHRAPWKGASPHRKEATCRRISRASGAALMAS